MIPSHPKPIILLAYIKTSPTSLHKWHINAENNKTLNLNGTRHKAASLMHVSLEVLKRHLLSHNNSILLTSNYSLTHTHTQKKTQCTVLSFYTKPGLQCLWCIVKHEQRKPFLQCLYFCRFLFLFSVCVRRNICTEQIQRDFIFSRTSVLVEPAQEASP